MENESLKILTFSTTLETQSICSTLQSYGQGKYLLAEMEFNPLVISHGKLVALDVILRFKENMPVKIGKTSPKIDCLLHPKTIGIIGVSPNP